MHQLKKITKNIMIHSTFMFLPVEWLPPQYATKHIPPSLFIRATCPFF